MEIMGLITNNLFLVLGLIGALAFLVSVITEVTKGIGFLTRIPTDLQVIVLSMMLCLVTYFMYTAYSNLVVYWYYVAASVVASFIVAFVAMYGWDNLTELYSRFKK